MDTEKLILGALKKGDMTVQNASTAFSIRMLIVLLAITAPLFVAASHAELSCSVTARASCTGTIMAGVYDSDNAHAESSTEYSNVICCTEQYGTAIGTSCSGSLWKNVTLFKLSAATNAHAEQNTQSNYGTNVCASTTANLSMTYASSCAAYDTCVASISDVTNAHVGDCNTYTTKICATNKNLSLTDTEGMGKRVGSYPYGPISLTVNFYNEGDGTHPSGRSGAIWIEKSPGSWDTPKACTTDASGNCTISFFPDCTYTSGIRQFKGGPYGDALYRDKNSTAANLTVDLSGRCEGTVTFVLEGNIVENANDNGDVDGHGTGLYRRSDITKFYSCIEDLTKTGSPAVGLVSVGPELNYINLTSSNSYVMKVSQFRENNKLLIAFTDGGCSALRTGVADAMKGSLKPFSSFLSDVYNKVQIVLSYPGVDIIGDMAKTGAFTLNFQKNETNVTQIIVRD